MTRGYAKWLPTGVLLGQNLEGAAQLFTVFSPSGDSVVAFASSGTPCG